MNSFDGLLSQFGTNQLFHVQFQMLLPDLPTDFSGGRSGGLVFPSFQNFSLFVVIHTVQCFGVVNKAEVDVFLELSCFFHDPEVTLTHPLNVKNNFPFQLLVFSLHP